MSEQTYSEMIAEVVTGYTPDSPAEVAHAHVRVLAKRLDELDALIQTISERRCEDLQHAQRVVDGLLCKLNGATLRVRELEVELEKLA